MKVCTCCFSDIELKSFISSNSKEKGKCDYCTNGINSDTIAIEELLDFFQSFLSLFKKQEDGIPLIDIIQNDWNLFEDKDTAINILSTVLLAIDTSLNSDVSQNVNYSDSITDSVNYWDKLKYDLKWTRRFTTDFRELEDFSWDSIFSEKRSGIVINIDEKELYRSRIHLNGQASSYPIKEMGAPPKEKVASGRANPKGIPFLYLSEKKETTLYEVRASYLDEISIGIFKVIESIKLIDFTSASQVSIFDASQQFSNLEEFVIGVLLKKKISADLSRPQRRYDSELEYIPTQFICEFIKYLTGADGIKFSSSLDSDRGNNIVLFSADKVECIDVERVRINRVYIESEKF